MAETTPLLGNATHEFPPEHQLLLCCARVHLTANDRERLLTLVNAELDWDEVVRETLRQCIVPLIYRHLQAECAEATPPEVLDRLRMQYLLAAAKSLALAAELTKIVELLDGHGVDSLPYKGPVLALQAYGDIALRTFTDLDLLVRPGDVARAREILGRRGYSPLDQLSASQETAVLRLEHNLPLVSDDGDVIVELHWRVAPASFTFPVPMERLWDRSAPVTLAGKTVRGMAVDDLMLLLAVHGTRHAWSAVEWIVGIAELIRQPRTICWERVIRDSERLRVGRIVRLAVALANRLLDAPIPANVATWIDDDSRISPLVAWVAKRLFEPNDVHSAGQQWAVFRFEMGVKDGARERFRDGFRRVTYPTGKDWAATGLPGALFPLYHVIRPVRLLGRYLAHALSGKSPTR